VVLRLLLLAAILLPANMLIATTSSAQTCDPFQATFKMELFPHSFEEIPFYMMISSSGCPSFPGNVHCLAQTVLPPDALLLTPEEALQNKCESIVQAIQDSCPRFVVSDIDCDPTPGQMTQFTVTDGLCDGEAVPVGDGIALASANELSALSSFDPAGTLLTDYEFDTVISGCPEEGGNGVVISGDGGTGISIFPGGAAAFEVHVTTQQTGTVSHSELTQGVSPEQMAAVQASILSQTFLALGDSTVCVANGRVLTCSSAGPAGFSSHEAPVIGAVSNDPGMPVAMLGGSGTVVGQMKTAIEQGGCESLDDCPALGTNVPEPGGVVSLVFGSILLSILARARRRNGGR
jgi:hypothetical protein